jgi:hypothetical protein
MLDVSLVSGAVPVVVLAAGLAALIALTARRALSELTVSPPSACARKTTPVRRQPSQTCRPGTRIRSRPSASPAEPGHRYRVPAAAEDRSTRTQPPTLVEG